MEYASNGSLEDVLCRIKKGDPPRFWTHETISCVIVGVVLGMKYLHSKDIIHRDLKPGNILLDDKHRVRICDFGTAVFEDCGTTTAVCTFAYVAPETLEEAPPTKKVDVFGFGLIVYELLVGESVLPKDGNIIRISNLHKNGFRPEIPRSVSPPIRKLIESCWCVNPESRPTFDEIYRILEDAWFPFFNDVLPKVVNDYVWEIRQRETGI
jgi:serine/threonine protein kinase